MRLLLVFLYLLLPLSLQAEVRRPPFATVLKVEGLASLEPLHTNLVEGMELSEGDRITVMSKSKLKLRIGNSAVLQVGADSDLLLKKDRESTLLLRLAHGKLLVASADSKPLLCRTGQLSFRIASTGFYVDHQKDSPAFLAVYQGSAEVKWPKGSTSFVARDREQASFYNPEKGSPEPAGSKRRDPPAEELEVLRKLL